MNSSPKPRPTMATRTLSPAMSWSLTDERAWSKSSLAERYAVGGGKASSSRRAGSARDGDRRLRLRRLELRRLSAEPDEQADAGGQRDDADVLRQRHAERHRVGVVAEHLVQEAVHGVADEEQREHLAVAAAEREVRAQEQEDEERADRLVKLGRVQAQRLGREGGQSDRLVLARVDDVQRQRRVPPRPVGDEQIPQV